MKCIKSIGTVLLTYRMHRHLTVNFIELYLRNTISVFHIEKWISHTITINLGLQMLWRKRSKWKNELYIIRNKANAPNGSNEGYRMYRNKLNHILRSAEPKNYQDLLIEHKTNVTKSWQIIKGIINKSKYRPNNTKFKHNGAIIEDGKLVADKFNKYLLTSVSFWLNLFHNRRENLTNT